MADRGNSQAKKQNFKHDVSSTDTSGFETSQETSKDEVQTVQLDEEFFDSTKREGYESLKKLKQSRLDQNKIKEISEKAFQIIENRDKLGLNRFLDQNASVPLVDIIDARGYTLMHMACFKNLEEIGLKLMDRAIETVTDSQIEAWLNHKTTDDGFTALHFASFRGNLVLIKLLLKHGSDMHIKNFFGINVMHVAAQGD